MFRRDGGRVDYFFSRKILFGIHPMYIVGAEALGLALGGWLVQGYFPNTCIQYKYVNLFIYTVRQINHNFSGEIFCSKRNEKKS